MSANEPVVCGLVRRAAEPQAATVSCRQMMSAMKSYQYFTSSRGADFLELTEFHSV